MNSSARSDSDQPSETCECCEKPIEGESILDMEEGISFCGPCAVSLIEAERDRLREALSVAADDLGKAANQFDGMRESQRHGYNVPVEINPERFAEKAALARAALGEKP